jgi:hypothetical protein
MLKQVIHRIRYILHTRFCPGITKPFNKLFPPFGARNHTSAWELPYPSGRYPNRTPVNRSIHSRSIAPAPKSGKHLCQFLDIVVGIGGNKLPFSIRFWCSIQVEFIQTNGKQLHDLPGKILIRDECSLPGWLWDYPCD